MLDGTARRDERLAWLAARYNAFAFHQPNDMPDPTEGQRPTRIDPEVEREMKALRNAARLRADMERARRHGR